MTFDVIIFATALYALTTESIEDSFVLMIFQITFGKKNLAYGLIASSITVSLIMLAIVLYGLPNIEPYSEYVIKGSGLFLVVLGSYWITKYWLKRKGILKSKKDDSSKSVSILGPSVIIFGELLEILAILIPFVLANHVAETSLSIVISLAISLGLMFVVGGRLRTRLKNRLHQVKQFAGIALILSGIVIILHIR